MHKKEIINALNNNAKELRQGIDMHCCLVSSILEGKADEQCLRRLCLESCAKYLLSGKYIVIF